MFDWIYEKYFYLSELIVIIDEIEIQRQLRRVNGSTMSSTFSQDLKDKLNGIKIINEEAKITQL
tara:strand:+ start:1320 stop:1511 length:192 start_codon:yes stop_codon:yes gene_type:complete